ncbi:MAG: DNA polymerase IV [bacterium]
MTDSIKERVILLVDLNAFFASVEQVSNPMLKGKPIAVIGSGKRTVITTCSYEARKFGVKTGMTTWEGKRACPELILVIGDNRKYTDTSTRIMSMLYDYTPQVEVCSIDEAFLDISGSFHLFGTPQSLAQELKDQIYRKFGLTCSVGISHNKLLAKLGAELQKPDGLVTIKSDQVSDLLENMPVSEMFGIGRKTARNLSGYGIETCGELARFPVEILKKRFGIIGEHLHNIALGIDRSPVVSLKADNDVKSIGHSTTFDNDISDQEELHRQIRRLSEMVGRRARRHHYSGRTVSLGIRYSDFTSLHKQRAIAEYINQGEDIYKVALGILDTVSLRAPVRLVGVTISQLRKGSCQPSLFDSSAQKIKTTVAMDIINDEYGEFTITQARLLHLRKHARVIAPAYRPIGPQKIEME